MNQPKAGLYTKFSSFITLSDLSIVPYCRD